MSSRIVCWRALGYPRFSMFVMSMCYGVLPPWTIFCLVGCALPPLVLNAALSGSDNIWYSLSAIEYGTDISLCTPPSLGATSFITLIIVKLMVCSAGFSASAPQLACFLWQIHSQDSLVCHNIVTFPPICSHVRHKAYCFLGGGTSYVTLWLISPLKGSYWQRRFTVCEGFRDFGHFR